MRIQSNIISRRCIDFKSSEICLRSLHKNKGHDLARDLDSFYHRYRREIPYNDTIFFQLEIFIGIFEFSCDQNICDFGRCVGQPYQLQSEHEDSHA